jgi:hypothetical protein
MTSLLQQTQRWRQRARELRVLADDTSNAVTKLRMLALANSYDRVAERAEERLQPPEPKT